MRELWFQYVIDNKDQWCNGFTTNRLLKVKDAVLGDSDIMFDLLKRHSAEDYSPAVMRAKDSFMFNHCLGNLVCNIRQKMIDEKIIKNK